MEAYQLPFNELMLEVNSGRRKGFTYRDYSEWEVDKRFELIDGIPYMMASPSRRHQEVLVELTRQFSNFLLGKPCQVFAAPFDVRLNAAGQDDIVVQPDIFVVCDSKKLDDGKSCIGAPDLIIEILSPSNPEHDFLRKRYIYQDFGILEYWIIDPENASVTINILKDGIYKSDVYKSPDKLPASVPEGIVVDFEYISDRSCASCRL